MLKGILASIAFVLAIGAASAATPATLEKPQQPSVMPGWCPPFC